MQITSQQFNAAYKKLPYVLREYIAEDELTSVTEVIGNEYGLHIDTTGALYREVTNMLLGFVNPEQFVGELKSIGIPQSSIGALVKDLNMKVFMPLREKMQHATEEAPESEEDEESVLVQTPPSPAPVVMQYAPAPTPPVAPRPVPPPPSAYVPPVYVAPAPIMPAATATPIFSETLPPIPPHNPAPAYVPPTTPLRPSVSEFSRPSVAPIAPATSPVPSAPPAPAAPSYTRPVMAAPPTAPVSAPASPTYSPPDPTAPPISVSSVQPQLRPTPYSPVAENVHIAARTMAQDMKAAQAGHQTQAQPAQQPAPVQVPRPQPRITSMPKMPMTTPKSSVQVSGPAIVAPKQSENRDALHAVLKEYGVDPYREPLV